MVQIRELQLDDYPAICELNERNGLRTAPESQWRRLWVDNPHADDFADVPKGWVMQDRQQQIVGAACNVPVMYVLGGEPIRTSTGMAWAVDESHRNVSLLLLDAFFSQDRVDLLLNTTANPVAGKAWEAFNAQRLPQADYDRNLMWITRYQRFAKAATRRLDWRSARVLQIPLAGLLAGQDVWRRRRSGLGQSSDLQTSIERLDRFDDRFDSFWERLRNEGDGRLRAARDARSLEWHFRPALEREEVFILACPDNKGESIDGYLIARRNDRPDIRLRRYQVADLQVLPGRSELVPRLVSQALEVAHRQKAAVMELTGFEPSKHQLAGSIPHRTRRLPTWPYFYKCRDGQLQQRLSNPEAWDPSPFDGDATL